MRPEELSELLRTRPFMPLRIHLTDGSQYDIRHPEMVIVLRQRVDIGVPFDLAAGVAERVEHCSLLHVVRVEELSPVQSTDGSSTETYSG
jgi:hypothetical protein